MDAADQYERARHFIRDLYEAVGDAPGDSEVAQSLKWAETGAGHHRSLTAGRSITATTPDHLPPFSK
jgi:hypothetical protein